MITKLKKAIVVYDSKYDDPCATCVGNILCRFRKALLINDAKYGNTKRIALALSKGLRSEGLATNCVVVWHVTAGMVDSYDLLVIGGPSHAFGLTDEIKKFMKKLEKSNLKGKKAFVFDTKFRRQLFKSCARRIEDNLRNMKVEIVKTHSSAIVKRKGFLEVDEEKKFRQIGSEIAKDFLSSSTP